MPLLLPTGSKVLALDVFDQGDRDRCGIGYLPDHHRDGIEARQLSRAPAALAGNDFILLGNGCITVLASGRTTIGCIRPWARIDAASSCSDSWSHVLARLKSARAGADRAESPGRQYWLAPSDPDRSSSKSIFDVAEQSIQPATQTCPFRGHHILHDGESAVRAGVLRGIILLTPRRPCRIPGRRPLAPARDKPWLPRNYDHET